ncbi:hypothetical protein FRC03_008923 [Tulasnella sp. 419]|nr:hypothetical protein FRC03_008923 [Tulasnella sp. 419]
MKFGKTYSALIYNPDFPEEWREKAIDYRQLKKLINQVVIELHSLGLNPAILRHVLERDTTVVQPPSPSTSDPGSEPVTPLPQSVPEIVVIEDEPFYEVSKSADVSLHLSPRLRRRLSETARSDDKQPTPKAEGKTHHLRPSQDSLEEPDSDSSKADLSEKPAADPPPISLMESSVDLRVDNPLWKLQSRSIDAEEERAAAVDIPPRGISPILFEPQSPTENLIIPLSSDTAFFQLLASAIDALTSLYKTTLNNCAEEVETLTDSISHSARPSSQGKSDLYAWREIFQSWVEAEIFESLSERTRGERSVEESEKRLTMFANQMVKRGLADGGRTFRLKSSKDAMKRFLALNVLILDMKKFQLANSEATRKILKKHEKRTSLPATSTALVPSLTLQVTGGTSLPHVLLVLITNTLLPVIPAIDDYTCLICTSVAFKPIRLGCGHLFCVRCLAKMQKRKDPRHAHCPLCRAPTVFEADASNLDMALMNFLKDWFPREVKAKAHDNEMEIAYEIAEDLGYGAPGGTAAPGECCVM